MIIICSYAEINNRNDRAGCIRQLNVLRKKVNFIVFKRKSAKVI